MRGGGGEGEGRVRAEEKLFLFFPINFFQSPTPDLLPYRLSVKKAIFLNFIL